MKRIWCALLGLSLLHCGSDDSGGSGSGSGGTSATDYPLDVTEPGIAAFVDQSSYSTSTWTAETAGPRDATSPVSPHGRVRVWMNSVLQASHAAGEGTVGGTPLDQNSMAVKELYDATDVLVGHAVILRVGTGIQEVDTLYYCKGPAGRCWGTPTDTGSAFGAGFADCAGCHGGLVFTGIPQ
jgi:hypothetical protein